MEEIQAEGEGVVAVVVAVAVVGVVEHQSRMAGDGLVLSPLLPSSL